MHVWQDWAKSWMFVANRPDICPHPPGTHELVGVGFLMVPARANSGVSSSTCPGTGFNHQTVCHIGQPPFCRPSCSGRRLLDVLKMGEDSRAPAARGPQATGQGGRSSSQRPLAPRSPGPWALWQYVGDLLAWLDRVSSQIWASLAVVLLLILSVPMSWHKAALSDTVDWIGWRISVSVWTVSVPPDKLQRIFEQIQVLRISKQPSVRDLQSLIGRLLWLTSAWHYLRPLLIPLYIALQKNPATMVGMTMSPFNRWSMLLTIACGYHPH